MIPHTTLIRTLGYLGINDYFYFIAQKSGSIGSSALARVQQRRKQLVINHQLSSIKRAKNARKKLSKR